MTSMKHIHGVIGVVAGIFLFLLIGCASGGGTEASGLRIISGTATDESNGGPAAAVTVTIIETGETAVTDLDGKFVIQSESSGDRITLMFEDSSSLSTQAVVDSVSSAGADLDVHVDRQNNSVTVQQVIPLPTATATPVAPTATVNPTATQVPPQASATPTATATLTNTPTATPFVPGVCDCDLNGNAVVDSLDFSLALNQYAAGNFDFNRDGQTTPVDTQYFLAVCDPLTGESCI